MKSLLFAFAFLCIGVQEIAANTYPISPRPLRKLIKESQLIVIANVLSVEENNDKTWSNAKAILEVTHILQGPLQQKRIEVYFSPNMICPSPARYTAGTRVMAFLDATEDGKGYSTHALSYGAKTLDEAGIAIYRQKVKEMQAILTIKDKKRQNDLTVDWLIGCAKNPYTRWEGTYELSPESDFMSFYDRDQETFVRKIELNDTQRQELREVVLNLKTIEYQDIGLIDLVMQPGDTEILELLTTSLKSADLSTMWHKEFLMQRVAALTRRNELIALLKDIEDIGFSKDREAKINVLAKEFIEKL